MCVHYMGLWFADLFAKRTPLSHHASCQGISFVCHMHLSRKLPRMLQVTAVFSKVSWEARVTLAYILRGEGE